MSRTRVVALIILVAALASGGTAAGFVLTDGSAAEACDRAKQERSTVGRLAVENTGGGVARADAIREAALVLGAPPDCFALDEYHQAFAQMKQALYP